jgi:formylglycine-generating enzyme required for sulfatase activity
MLIAFKIKLALVCAAGLAGPLALTPLIGGFGANGAADIAEPPLVELAPGHLSYRAPGDFTRAGKQAAAPLVTFRFDKPLAIMRHQVSAADYQACVADHICPPLGHDVAVALDRPAVQVSWHDAAAYATWLSRKTGARYRLPSDAEWAYAAASRFRDDEFTPDERDPAKRWIARYERESGNKEDSEPRRFGSFGINENGLADLAGNVWEWTTTCFTRSVLDEAGNTVKTRPNCGVRLAEGAHRAYVTDFIRDARAGGCASGTPPSNLGFRLVREPRPWADRVAYRLNQALAAIRS